MRSGVLAGSVPGAISVVSAGGVAEGLAEVVGSSMAAFLGHRKIMAKYLKDSLTIHCCRWCYHSHAPPLSDGFRGQLEGVILQKYSIRCEPPGSLPSAPPIVRVDKVVYQRLKRVAP